MIEKFNAATVSLIGIEIEQALGAVAEKHGVVIRPAGGKFGETNAELKFTLLLKDSTGVPITPERASFLRFAGEFGLEPTDLDREFVHNGFRWTVVGLKPNNPKFPILARKNIDGRLFKLTADAVKYGLSKVSPKSDQPLTTATVRHLRLTGGEEEEA